MARVVHIRKMAAIGLAVLLVGGCGDDSDEGAGGSGPTGSGSGGQGGGLTCVDESDCPDPQSACLLRTCEQGSCGTQAVAAGTALGTQAIGDCRVEQCDGLGGVQSMPDDSDAPNDGNDCTVDACAGGVPEHTPAAAGSPCAQGGSLCDGGGSCVDCITADDCPGTDDECQMRTCEAGACGVDHTAAGMPITAQTAGDCLEAQCDGNGAVMDVADDTDLPDDANECTDDLCSGGVPMHADAAAGTSCTQMGGQVCDGVGSCVECVDDTQCGSSVCLGNVCAPAVVSTVPADGATGVSVDTSLTITFSEAMDPTTLTAQTAAGPCSGSIQLSHDGFSSCVALASAAPAMSGGDTVATLAPAPALAYGIGYAIRVTTAAQASGGVPLAAEYTQANGFTTAAPSPCAGGVLLSQIYGAGGNVGALFTHDFVELHNGSDAAVTLDGWSLQYASAAGTSWQVTPLSGSVAPGGHYLVQLSGGVNGAPLPAPDATGSTAMSASAGKIALVAGTTALSGACPTDASIVDRIGYGATASCSETAPTANLGAATAAHRDVGGCFDQDDNAGDFVLAAPSPKNAQSTVVGCACASDPAHNESGAPAEADYCNVQFPTSFSVAQQQLSPAVYGRIFEAGLTESPGAPPGVVAQLGYGRDGVSPVGQGGWAFVEASFNIQSGNDDEFDAMLRAPAAAVATVYRYTYRFSLDGGASWTYCDLDGAGSNAGLTFAPAQLGTMTVTP